MNGCASGSRVPRGILVVADPGERWLRAVAGQWAGTSQVRVTWLAGRGTPAVQVVDGVRMVRTRGTVVWRAITLAGRHDAVLVGQSGRRSGLRLVALETPVVHVVDEWTARWRPRGSVVVGSPAQRRALRADGGWRRPIFVVPRNMPQRGADLLAGVLMARLTEASRSRRRARPDMSTVVGYPSSSPAPVLRATDEVWTDGDRAVALLHGCDGEDARNALARHGITPTFVRLATDADLLLGPGYRET